MERRSPFHKRIRTELTMTNIFIIIFGIIFLCGLLFYEKKKNTTSLLIAKSVLSFLFVMTALLQPRPVPAYYHYLLVGLIFCLIGDVCLALPQDKAFRIGLIAFLIGHIFYIFSFSSLIQIDQWFSGLSFYLFGISALIFLWLRPHLKSMLIPVLLYIVVITLMLSGAWAVFLKSPFHVLGRTILLSGSLCFYVSDIFVARDKFIKEEFLNRLLGLPLYYAGQFMLAFSIGLL